MLNWIKECSVSAQREKEITHPFMNTLILHLYVLISNDQYLLEILSLPIFIHRYSIKFLISSRIENDDIILISTENIFQEIIFKFSP